MKAKPHTAAFSGEAGNAIEGNALSTRLSANAANA